MCSRNFENQFWVNVLEYWTDFCFKNKPLTNSEILQSCLWYNRQISKHTLYYPVWHKKGINLVGDIINYDGIAVSETELNSTYNFTCNSIEYHRMKLLVNKFLKTKKNGNVFFFFFFFLQVERQV